jgi:hypothetical protein
MTSISGISGSDPQLYDLTQSLASTRSSSETAPADGTASGGPAQKLGGLRDKIDAAVSSALQNLDKSTDAKDVFQTIKTAVDGVLKDNGVDPAKVQQHRHHHHHGYGGGAGGSAGGGGGAGGSAGGGGVSAHIDDLLRQNGFDPDQLRQQLASSAGSGASTADPTAPISDLVAGPSVDVQA